MKGFKKLLKAIGILLGLVVAAALALFVWLWATEFRPEAEEPVTVEEPVELPLNKVTFTVLSWNIGYSGLGEESDFFMDGGTMVRSDSKLVEKNYAGIQSFLSEAKTDFILLQEVDSDSKRSCGKDEVSELRAKLDGTSAYAMNYSTNYVPYPWPPLGRVHSGLLTFSNYEITEAKRISLPCPFSWPMSMVNLKRCLLVTRIPIEDSEQQLVLVNLHLEAYDDGEGKLAQSKQLREFLAAEYEKGNYVLAGGDWNQIFPDSETSYPNTHAELWKPGYLDNDELNEGWNYVWDISAPSCRLLNQPYDPGDTRNTQYYVIDGFLASPNLIVENVKTLDEGFRYSDHNPVLLTVSLGD